MKKTMILIIILFFLFPILTFTENEKGIKLKKLKNNEGRRWAILIGINEYQDKGILNLKKAQNDANALGNILKNQGQFDNIYIMTDDKDFRDNDFPTYFKIKDRLSYISSFLKANDLVVFSFSGHGITLEGESRLLVSDSRIQDLKSTTISLEKDIVAMLNKAGVKKSLLLIDACRENFQENKGINRDGLKAKKFEKAEVAAAFYATKSGWYSYEDTETDYGAFTRFVVEGLEGNADKTTGNNDGIVSFRELSTYVEDGVFDWALKNDKKQAPYTKIYGESYGDLALTMAKNNKDTKKSTSQLVKPTVSISNNNLVLVEGGSFQMGSNNGEDDEKPIHEVIVNSFFIGKYEVTVEEWKKYLDDSKVNFDWYQNSWGDYPVAKYSTSDKHPMININKGEILEYCNWLSKKEGLPIAYDREGNLLDKNGNITVDITKVEGYRLPTEAEWEFAARGGNKTQNYKYSGSNNLKEVGWYGSQSKINAVGTKKANELGIFDMSGNVWELCQDTYDENAYSKHSKKNPYIHGTIEQKTIRRGGSWGSNSYVARVSDRYPSDPNLRVYFTGFRIAKTLINH